LELATANKFVNGVKHVVESYIKSHEIDVKLLATYQKLKHASKQIKPKKSSDTSSEKSKESADSKETNDEAHKQKPEENMTKLPTIDRTKKKELKKFLKSNVETAIRNNCRDIVEYFFSVYDFQFLSRYSPLGVFNSIHLTVHFHVNRPRHYCTLV
jgi:hypothetical protein